MKKSLMFVFGIILLIALMPLVLATDLDISLNYNPYPAIQGQQVTLEFTVINSGTGNLTDLEFTLDEGNAFDLVSKKTIPIDSLLSDDSITLTYLLEVEDDTSGKEDIELSYTYIKNTEEKEDEEEFTIKVAETNVFLTISNAKTTPENLIPGQDAELIITLKNEADSDVKDIIVKLDLTDLGFAYEDGVSEKKIDKINENDYEIVSFKILTLSQTAQGVYKVPVNLEYYDNYGQKYQKINLISLKVWSKPELEVSLAKNEIIQGAKGQVEIEIFNKGLTDVSFLDVKIKESDDYRLLSGNSFYVGKIESDDYDSIDLSILTIKENINLELEITYKDTNNKEYTEQVFLPIKTFSKEEAMQAGLIKPVIWPFIVLGIVVIIILWVIIAKVRKKKRKKNAQRLP